jgi:hypothetical protein
MFHTCVQLIEVYPCVLVITASIHREEARAPGTVLVPVPREVDNEYCLRRIILMKRGGELFHFVEHNLFA